MPKVNNKDNSAAPLASFWCFIVSFELISHLVSIINFEHVIAGCGVYYF